jgi:uncharacterized protein with beta-barrel porin domain
VQERLPEVLAVPAVTVLAVLGGLCLSTTPAKAQCAPDPASSGQTVTCSNDANGFDSGGVNNLTVNVLPGAVVNDNGTAGIAVSDFSVVTNNGTIAAASGATGIFAGQNNAITNTATGTITVAGDGFGIFVAGNSTVTNAGAIIIGPSVGPPAAGILAISDFNTIVNAAGATITTGDFGYGIFVNGNDAKVSNAGSVVTSDGPALAVQGDRAVITNSGTMTSGALGAGIVFTGTTATITNTISGNIIGGNDAAGIFVFGDSVTITNRGTITVGDGFLAVGIESNTFGGINNIINTGTINVGAGATGILVSGDGKVFNSGTINAPTGLAAIEFCLCSLNSSLTLGPGSSIQGLVIGSGTEAFQLGGTGKDTFNLSLIGVGQQYDGFATFNKVDTSNWTVIGTGAQDWNVLGGTLTVNGTISGTVTVQPGGTLGGNGFVGNTTINGGTLAPGNSVGLLTVQGSLVFTAASTYLVEVSSGADRTNVTASATPGGATVNAVLLGGNIVRQYTILNATGGVIGTFNPQVGINVPNFIPTLSYDLNNVYLNFALSFDPPGGLNVNQRNVANTLTNFFNSTGGIPLAFGALSPAGLTQLSGETATGTQQATFDAMNLFLGLLTDPFIAGRGAGLSGSAGAVPFAADSASAYAAKRQNAARDAFAKFPTKADVARNDLFDRRWSVWGSAYGGSSTTDGNAALGSNNATARAFGFAAGADYRISPVTLAGFALAGGGTNFAVNGFGSGRSDLFQAGAFVRHTMDRAYVTAALAYGWQDVTTDRTVTVAGIDRLHAQFNANAWSGRVETGYRFVTPWMGVTPYAAGQFTTYSLPAYAEHVLSGSNTFALNYAARNVTASRSELGARADKSFAMQDGILTLRGRAAWAHNFNTDRGITPVFQTLPGAAFVVNGAAQAHDAALTTAAAEMNWLNGWSAAVTFEGEFSHVTRSYAGKGIARYTW